MTLPSLLLRLLLCVSLIANGAGTAQASMRMQFVHAGHDIQALPVSMSTDCHDAQAMVHDAAMPAMSHAAMGPDTVDHVQVAAVDCCDAESCQCACMQHASLAFVSVFLPLLGYAQSIVSMSGTSQHAPPRLPHLIRPPIG